MQVNLKDGRTALLFFAKKETTLWLPAKWVWASINGAPFQVMRKSKIKKDKKS